VLLLEPHTCCRLRRGGAQVVHVVPAALDAAALTEPAHVVDLIQMGQTWDGVCRTTWASLVQMTLSADARVAVCELVSPRRCCWCCW
jgi:hypothetical protein